MTPFRLKLQPGFFTEDSDRNADNRWVDGNLVRFKDGRPEKFGGWEMADIINDGAVVDAAYVGDVLLLHLDGTNGSTDIPDDSPIDNQCETAGTTALTTTDPKFGTASCSFAGNGSSRVRTPMNIALNLYNAQSWTVECFINTNDATQDDERFILSTRSFPAASGWQLTWNGPNTRLSFLQSGTDGYSAAHSSASMVAGTWHHVAVVWDGTDLTLFFDGIGNVPTPPGATNWDTYSAPYFSVGGGEVAAFTGTGWNGKIDEARVSRGVARYTGDFTPPTAPFAFDPGPASFISTKGIDRREHEWTSLDGQPWIAQGTSKKLYIINRGIRYDITPVRRSVTLTAPFTTSMGDATILVADPLHGAETGDFVRLTGFTPLAGIAITGEYEITVIDGNSYTIEGANVASGSLTGGGTGFADYDINIGGDSASQAHGWGTCLYGRGTFGTRRGDCSAIVTPLRIWSLDNFGEDLLASPRGGSLYWWDRTQGPSTRAVLIETAPQSIERMLVSPSGDQVIALGASDFNGAPDKMLIRTSDTGSIVDWVQPDDLDAENNAFDERLSNGSRIITGTKTRGGVIVNTDKMSYIMRADPNAIWAIEELAAQNAPVGPNATLDVNGTAIWMAQKKFIGFDGVQAELPCEVWGYIFDNDAAEEGKSPGFNLSQGDKVYAYYNDKGDEATWFYPSMASSENDRYVCFNTTQRIWYYGALARTAMSTGGIAYSLPYGSDPSGKLFLHEGVKDANGEVMGEYIQTFDMMIGEGEYATHVSLFEPDFKRWSGTMRMSIKTKDTPNQAAYGLISTYDMLDDVTEQGVYDAGRQMAVRFESTTLGSTWRMSSGTFYGQPDAGR